MTMNLLTFRKTDYVFDPVKFSSLDGKTGPYILYTVVRIKSILNKVEASDKINVINNPIPTGIAFRITSGIPSNIFSRKETFLFSFSS